MITGELKNKVDEINKLKQEKDGTKNNVNQDEEYQNKLKEEFDNLNNEYNNLINLYNALKKENEELRNNQNILLQNQSKYKEAYDNLTKDYSPPTELYCEVRALEDINGIDTYEGKINIEKNHTYSLRRNDIEHYIRRGLFTLNE